MRRMVKLFLVVTVVSLAVVFFQVPMAVHAQSTAEFVLKNETSFWVTLYIDGSKSCSAPPGDQCVDLVSPGQHNVKAEQTDDPNNYITNTFDVPPEGFTWTITETK